MVEFQPSGFSKGSYLNVCVHLLWHLRPDSLSFDIYRRERDFIEYVDDAQFAPLADALAEKAAVQLNALVASLRTPSDLSPLLVHEKHASWQTFHLAISLALSGRTSEALAQFARIVTATPSTDGYRDLQQDAGAFIAMLQQGDDIRAPVLERIIQGRKHHKLKAESNLLRDAA